MQPQTSTDITRDQQAVIELMKSLQLFVEDAAQKGYTKSHLLSALLNLAAMVSVEGGGKGKEFAATCRQIFNEMRDAMRAQR